jgi:hypothetical protein
MKALLFTAFFQLIGDTLCRFPVSFKIVYTFYLLVNFETSNVEWCFDNPTFNPRADS